MAARSPLLLGLTLLLALVTTSHAATCDSHKFPDNRTFANCTVLPALGAKLQYTYDTTNSSLSIAYTAAPGKDGGWVAWAINPTASGMVGSQALIALKLDDGSVVAKTYNISSYHSIVESKLSFEVWDLSAMTADGTMTIFATVKVPENVTSLNQVWQVGGAVKGDHPSIHPMSSENKASMSKLTLASPIVPVPAPAPSKSSADIPTFQRGALGLMSGLAMLVGSIILLLS